MSTRLFLYLTDYDAVRWLVFQSGEFTEEASGTWLELSDYVMDYGLSGSEVDVIVSGLMASFVTTQLSASQLKYVKKALPFALEDKLAQDPSQIQINVSQKNRQGQVTAWLTKKTLMPFIVQNTTELDLELNSVVIDVDLIGKQDRLQIWFSSSEDMLFYSSDIRFSATKEWLLAASEQDKTVNTVDLYLPEKLQETDIISHQVSSLFEQNVEHHVYVDTLFYQLVQSLLQGSVRPTQLYTKKTTTNPVVRSGIIRVMIAMLFLSLVFIASQYMDTRLISNKIDAYTHANQVLCKEIFGEQKQCRENLLRREVSALLKKTTPAPENEIAFISLLNILGEEIDSEVEIESVRYDEKRQELLVSAKGANLSALEVFKNRLLSRKISVELSATQQTTHSQGSLKIDLGVVAND